MFGSNVIHQQKHFQDAPAHHLKVVSIFKTIQGEGPYSGRPAVFVRLAHCNLNCSFCDTFFETGEFMQVDAIFGKVATLLTEIPSSKKLLVITGGEPLLQPNIVELIRVADRVGIDVQIETNGIPPLKDSPAILVISPKINEKIGSYIRPDENNLANADALKFVLSTEAPFNHIPQWAFGWRKGWREIYVSPMNVYRTRPHIDPSASFEARTKAERVSFWEEGLLDRERNRANHAFAARYALEHGCRLSIQQHIYCEMP